MMATEQKAKKSAYDQEYAKQNIIRKVLNFNRLKPEDMKALEQLSRQENMSEYIKRLILEDMRAKQE